MWCFPSLAQQNMHLRSLCITRKQQTYTVIFIIHAELSFVLKSGWVLRGYAELCGVLQQVFICQFSGCRCPALLKTSHGISWRCHGLDTTSNTHTLTRVSVYVCDTESYDLQRYLSPKRVVTVKNTHVALFVLKSEPLWIRVLKVDFCACVLLYRPIIAHCAGRAGPCVLQSLVVLWCWSDDWEREPAWRASHFVSVALPLLVHICFSQPFFSHLSVAYSPVWL